MYPPSKHHHVSEKENVPGKSDFITVLRSNSTHCFLDVSFGQWRRPSEKQKQLTYEQQEMFERCDAKAQKEHERLRRRQCMEVESEDEDDEDEDGLGHGRPSLSDDDEGADNQV